MRIQLLRTRGLVAVDCEVDCDSVTVGIFAADPAFLTPGSVVTLKDAATGDPYPVVLPPTLDPAYSLVLERACHDPVTLENPAAD